MPQTPFILAKLIEKSKLIYCQNKDFNTKHHIIVFESDDWGSIRMPRRNEWEILLQLGYAVNKRPYERFDTLESQSDLESLFEVLSRHKGADGKHPIITANMLMANPDFEHIEYSGLQKYYYEPIANTYTRYFGDAGVLDVMRQGINSGIFFPQCHGREHFNVSQWMHKLKEGDEDTLTAFNYGMCGIAPKTHPEIGNQLMNALRAENKNEQIEIDKIIAEGLSMFEKLWGFKSKTFVAPCYCWNKETEKTLIDNGVKLIQTSRVNKSAYKSHVRYFYTGQRNRNGVLYSIRNCQFEPSTNQECQNVGYLMKQIDNIFKQNKLAIFSTHRINYVSGIDENNRSQTLKILDDFLTQLLRKYPDTIFINSTDLLDILT